jgi:cephalosporin hydroxylase
MSKLPLCQGREWKSSLPIETIRQIQYAHALGPNQYEYHGITMWKNPFDLAIYTRLIEIEQPKLVIELGSFKGASAMWFADQMEEAGLDPNVVSVDVNPVSETYPDVTFITGDARKLAQVFDPSLIKCPHPWLVIDDADHVSTTTFLILEYFHKHLRKNDMIVVEDTIIEVLGEQHTYGGGPAQGLSLFLQRHDDEYAVQPEYCDMFGQNATWNINGYLRRL